MLNDLVDIVVLPLARRIGTAAAAVAITYGATEADASAIVAGVVAVAGLAYDLAVSRWSRRKAGR